MPHVLDNMIWNAITTGNKDIAIVKGDVGCYHPAIAPFAGMRDCNDKNLEKLYELITAGRRVALSFDDRMKLDETKWKPVQEMDVFQMVYEDPVDVFTTKSSLFIEPLGVEHVPQMLELTKLTKPGPFFDKTILFGNYFGIFEGKRLAAITGQRMHPLPYMEVSAVCTHPDFRGKGYAKTLMLHIMKIIIDNSFTPFLHVLTNNTTAIQLYETIGYRIRKKLFVDVFQRL